MSCSLLYMTGRSAMQRAQLALKRPGFSSRALS
jgi:hypothetical protein